MTALDWALLGVWLGFALAGFWKGAVRIVLGLGGLAAGVWIAVAAGGECAALLATWLGEGWIVAALGRALPAIACIALCLAAGWGISKTLEALHLGWLNRLAGVLLAGTVGLVLLALLLGVTLRASPAARGAIERSLLAPRLVAAWELVAGALAGPAEAGDQAMAAEAGSSGR
jgi:uncharacterized membrane protein required for colicin V production